MTGWKLAGAKIMTRRDLFPILSPRRSAPLGKLGLTPTDVGWFLGPQNAGNPNQYVKLQCFTAPQFSTLLGNEGRNTLTGPGLVDLDLP
jgi:hypothetical protein